jgi:hypothetical protein
MVSPRMGVVLPEYDPGGNEEPEGTEPLGRVEPIEIPSTEPDTLELIGVS